MARDLSPTIELGSGHEWLKTIGLQSLQVGRWYVGWRCRSCCWPAALFDDPAAGAIKVRVLGSGCAIFRCPFCSEITVDTAARSIQFRHDRLLQRLVQADRHLRQGDARIERLLRIVNALSLQGRSTAQAEDLLDAMLRAQGNIRWHRAMLAAELIERAALDDRRLRNRTRPQPPGRPPHEAARERPAATAR